LPIFTLGLLKHIAFKDGADVSVEVRAATHLDINSMGLVEFENFVQPKMYRIDSLQGNEGMFDEYGMVNLPVELPLSSLQLSSDAIYLINNGRTFYFRLGKSSDSRVLLEFFGISSLEGVLLDQLHLRYPDNTEGQSLLNRVWNILNYFRSISSIYHDIRIVREGDPGELRLYDLLIYDRTSSVMSLDEFVQFLSTS
jgi:protein transport protein SEC24